MFSWREFQPRLPPGPGALHTSAYFTSSQMCDAMCFFVQLTRITDCRSKRYLGARLYFAQFAVEFSTNEFDSDEADKILISWRFFKQCMRFWLL
jgi:hypothetical protein